MGCSAEPWRFVVPLADKGPSFRNDAIFLALHYINQSFEIIQAPSWGHVMENGTASGSLQLLQRNHADLTSLDFTPTSNRLSVFQRLSSIPLHFTYQVIVMNAKDTGFIQHFHWENVFHWQAWLFIAAVYSAFVLSILVREYTTRKLMHVHRFFVHLSFSLFCCLLLIQWFFSALLLNFELKIARPPIRGLSDVPDAITERGMKRVTIENEEGLAFYSALHQETKRSTYIKVRNAIASQQPDYVRERENGYTTNQALLTILLTKPDRFLWMEEFTYLRYCRPLCHKLMLVPIFSPPPEHFLVSFVSNQFPRKCLEKFNQALIQLYTRGQREAMERKLNQNRPRIPKKLEHGNRFNLTDLQLVFKLFLLALSVALLVFLTEFGIELIMETRRVTVYVVSYKSLVVE